MGRSCDCCDSYERNPCSAHSSFLSYNCGVSLCLGEDRRAFTPGGVTRTHYKINKEDTEKIVLYSTDPNSDAFESTEFVHILTFFQNVSCYDRSRLGVDCDDFHVTYGPFDSFGRLVDLDANFPNGEVFITPIFTLDDLPDSLLDSERRSNLPPEEMTHYGDEVTKYSIKIGEINPFTDSESCAVFDQECKCVLPEYIEYDLNDDLMFNPIYTSRVNCGGGSRLPDFSERIIDDRTLYFKLKDLIGIPDAPLTGNRVIYTSQRVCARLGGFIPEGCPSRPRPVFQESDFWIGKISSINGGMELDAFSTERDDDFVSASEFSYIKANGGYTVSRAVALDAFFDYGDIDFEEQCLIDAGEGADLFNSSREGQLALDLYGERSNICTVWGYSFAARPYLWNNTCYAKFVEKIQENGMSCVFDLVKVYIHDSHSTGRYSGWIWGDTYYNRIAQDEFLQALGDKGGSIISCDPVNYQSRAQSCLRNPYAPIVPGLQLDFPRVDIAGQICNINTPFQEGFFYVNDATIISGNRSSVDWDGFFTLEGEDGTRFRSNQTGLLDNLRVTFYEGADFPAPEPDDTAILIDTECYLRAGVEKGKNFCAYQFGYCAENCYPEVAEYPGPSVYEELPKERIKISTTIIASSENAVSALRKIVDEDFRGPAPEIERQATIFEKLSNLKETFLDDQCGYFCNTSGNNGYDFKNEITKALFSDNIIILNDYQDKVQEVLDNLCGVKEPDHIAIMVKFANSFYGTIDARSFTVNSDGDGSMYRMYSSDVNDFVDDFIELNSADGITLWEPVRDNRTDIPESADYFDVSEDYWGAMQEKHEERLKYKGFTIASKNTSEINPCCELTGDFLDPAIPESERLPEYFKDRKIRFVFFADTPEDHDFLTAFENRHFYAGYVDNQEKQYSYVNQTGETIAFTSNSIGPPEGYFSRQDPDAEIDNYIGYYDQSIGGDIDSTQDLNQPSTSLQFIDSVFYVGGAEGVPIINVESTIPRKSCDWDFMLTWKVKEDILITNNQIHQCSAPIGQIYYEDNIYSPSFRLVYSFGDEIVSPLPFYYELADFGKSVFGSDSAILEFYTGGIEYTESQYIEAERPTPETAPTEQQLSQMLTLAPISINANWSFESDSSLFDFLGDGETLILAYSLNMQTGSSGAITDTQNVIVTITGTTGTPTVTINSNPTDVGFSVSDSFSEFVFDFGLAAGVDNTDNIAANLNLVISGSASGSASVPSQEDLFNMFDITAVDLTVGYVFSSPLEIFDYLLTGESLDLFYTAEITNGDGAQIASSQEIEITIDGSVDGSPTINSTPETDDGFLIGGTLSTFSINSSLIPDFGTATEKILIVNTLTSSKHNLLPVCVLDNGPCGSRVFNHSDDVVRFGQFHNRQLRTYSGVAYIDNGEHGSYPDECEIYHPELGQYTGYYPSYDEFPCLDQLVGGNTTSQALDLRLAQGDFTQQLSNRRLGVYLAYCNTTMSHQEYAGYGFGKACRGFIEFESGATYPHQFDVQGGDPALDGFRDISVYEVITGSILDTAEAGNTTLNDTPLLRGLGQATRFRRNYSPYSRELGNINVKEIEVPFTGLQEFRSSSDSSKYYLLEGPSVSDIYDLRDVPLPSNISSLEIDDPEKYNLFLLDQIPLNDRIQLRFRVNYGGTVDFSVCYLSHINAEKFYSIGNSADVFGSATCATDNCSAYNTNYFNNSLWTSDPPDINGVFEYSNGVLHHETAGVAGSIPNNDGKLAGHEYFRKHAYFQHIKDADRGEIKAINYKLKVLSGSIPCLLFLNPDYFNNMYFLAIDAVGRRGTFSALSTPLLRDTYLSTEFYGRDEREQVIPDTYSTINFSTFRNIGLYETPIAGEAGSYNGFGNSVCPSADAIPAISDTELYFIMGRDL